jgi:transposase
MSATPAPRRPLGLTIGLDVGDRFSVFHSIDADGDFVERGKVGTTPQSLEKWFGPMPPSRIVLETSTHSPWISRLLKRLGHTAIVANTRRVQLIGQNDSKSDEVDAELLARLGRADPKLLAPVQHRSEATQCDLAYLRTRDVLVRSRSLLISHVRGSVKSLGHRIPKCSTDSFARQAAPALPVALRSTLTPVLDQIAALTTAIQAADRAAELLLETRYPTAKALTQVSGVGALTALCFVLTLEDPHRFPSSRAVGSYLGLRPRLRKTALVDPECRITRAGDAMLRRLLITSAHYILGPFGPASDLRQWGEALATRGKKAAKKRAVVAVARKLAVLLHHLWLTQEVYVPLKKGRPAKSLHDADRLTTT